MSPSPHTDLFRLLRTRLLSYFSPQPETPNTFDSYCQVAVQGLAKQGTGSKGNRPLYPFCKLTVQLVVAHHTNNAQQKDQAATALAQHNVPAAELDDIINACYHTAYINALVRLTRALIDDDTNPDVDALIDFYDQGYSEQAFVDLLVTIRRISQAEAIV